MFLNFGQRQMLPFGRKSRRCFPFGPVITTVFLALQSTFSWGNDLDSNQTLRCAIRTSIAITGSSPSKELLEAPRIQDFIDQLLASDNFIEYFSRFINATFNSEPGKDSAADAPYHLAKYVLQNKEPFHKLFNGPYMVEEQAEGLTPRVIVNNNPIGLGYFRSKAWMDRYAGNDTEGLRLVTAYRMVNNVLGMEVTATTNAPGVDVTAKGRESPACRYCHFDAWFALDPLAQVLSRVRRDANNLISYIPSDETPKSVLGGKMVRNDKELIDTMVNSDEFAFSTCRLSFKFLFGREVNSCESVLFDKCIQTFKSNGMIQSALSTIAKDPSFCQ